MKFKAVSLAALTLLAGAAQAQSSVTVYGRVDLSAAQQADAVDNKEIRNGSGMVNERRDNMAAGLKKTGYDLGIKHNF